MLDYIGAWLTTQALQSVSTTAYAAGSNPTAMIENAKSLLVGGVQFLGAAIIVFGLVNLGMTIKDGMQGGGGQLSGAIAMIIGGAIVIGAATYFGSLPTDWVK